MAAPIWSQTNTLTLLTKKPEEFDFFQAVRLLEKAGFKPNFKNEPNLTRATNSITKINIKKNSADLSVNFMGLSGTHGVMPEHYTELLLERLEHRDYALRDFLDIFNNRLLSIFYSLWHKSQIEIIAANTKKINSSSSLQDPCIYYAGVLSQKVRSSTGLSAILQDYFSLPIKVLQFTGEWIELLRGQRTLITQSQIFNHLGINTIVGGRIWQIKKRFNIEIGPLSYDQFLRLLPKSNALKTMKEFVNFYVGKHFQFTYTLLLKRSEIPPCQLRKGVYMQLGWNTWLKLPASEGIARVYLERINIFSSEANPQN